MSFVNKALSFVKYSFRTFEIDFNVLLLSLEFSVQGSSLAFLDFVPLPVDVPGAITLATTAGLL